LRARAKGRLATRQEAPDVVGVGMGHDHLVDVGRLDTHRAQFADHASGGPAHSGGELAEPGVERESGVRSW
jgi:hypothetical protein